MRAPGHEFRTSFGNPQCFAAHTTSFNNQPGTLENTGANTGPHRHANPGRQRKTVTHAVGTSLKGSIVCVSGRRHTERYLNFTKSTVMFEVQMILAFKELYRSKPQQKPDHFPHYYTFQIKNSNSLAPYPTTYLPLLFAPVPITVNNYHLLNIHIPGILLNSAHYFT